MYLIFLTVLLSSSDWIHRIQQNDNTYLIWRYAELYDQSPHELIAIAYTESRLDHRAVSSTKDIGLFQINCNAWKKEFDNSYDKCKEMMLDPHLNTITAINIVRHYRKQYNNCKKDKVFYCYNGGPGWKNSNNIKNIIKYGSIVKKRRQHLVRELQ